jgi:hypothetical protein
MLKTMTVEEVYKTLRGLGVKTTPVRIRRGIDQGKYPFGISVDMGTSVVYEIYEKKFRQWLKDVGDFPQDKAEEDEDIYMMDEEGENGYFE